jgi:HSP20 family protein
MSQQGGPSSQQGSSQQQQAGQMGGQQGSASSPQQGSGQQQQFSGSTGQQGGSVRRGGSGGFGMPSLFGGFGGSRGGPFEMLRRLDEDVDRLFHEFIGGGRNLLRGGGGPRGAGAQASMWLPQVEVCEQGGKLHVYADLPGLSKEDVQISIQDDQLVVQGERRSSSEEGQQGSGYYHSERSYGSFYRSIPLPEGVNPETAEASFKDGVLDVCFDAPNRQPRSRQIPIREGGPAAGSTSGAAAGSSGSVGSGSATSGGLGATGSMGATGSSAGGLGSSGGGTPASSAAGSEVGPQE